MVALLALLRFCLRQELAKEGKLVRRSEPGRGAVGRRQNNPPAGWLLPRAGAWMEAVKKGSAPARVSSASTPLPEGPTAMSACTVMETTVEVAALTRRPWAVLSV